MPTKIDAILSRMTIDEKLGQMILASIEVSQMNDATREFLCANHIGNVILFGKKLRRAGKFSPAQHRNPSSHSSCHRSASAYRY